MNLSGRLQRDERQIQLLNAANAIILEKGTDALTLITLAERAGVTKPVTYKHFGNRKSLLHALFKYSDDALTARMNAQMEKPISDLKDAVTVCITTYFECMADDGEAFNATVAALKAYPEFSDIGLDVQDFFCQILQRSLQKYLPENFRIPEWTAIMIFGATESLCIMMIKDPALKPKVISEAVWLVKTLLADQLNRFSGN
ncbi:TetR family transcriptional regulator [Morganella psychrotolerans]|uniref:TetR family transcriptional regulator n=1 Tax=Morganella psychrotolerans TaxID=368603 RepID=A0A1B8H7D8_9GAMM|nr:TetR family transcriptional regulator [Morganella psychrotolerans]